MAWNIQTCLKKWKWEKKFLEVKKNSFRISRPWIFWCDTRREFPFVLWQGFCTSPSVSSANAKRIGRKIKQKKLSFFWALTILSRVGLGKVANEQILFCSGEVYHCQKMQFWCQENVRKISVARCLTLVRQSLSPTSSVCRRATQPGHEVRVDAVEPEGVLPRGAPSVALPQLLQSRRGRSHRHRPRGPLHLDALCNNRLYILVLWTPVWNHSDTVWPLCLLAAKILSQLTQTRSA